MNRCLPLVYEEPAEFEIGGCSLRASKTGRVEQRGEIFIGLANLEAAETLRKFSPDEAEKIGLKLIELANIARRLSTRGCVGSTE